MYNTNKIDKNRSTKNTHLILPQKIGDHKQQIKHIITTARIILTMYDDDIDKIITVKIIKYFNVMKTQIIKQIQY